MADCSNSRVRLYDAVLQDLEDADDVVEDFVLQQWSSLGRVSWLGVCFNSTKPDAVQGGVSRQPGRACGGIRRRVLCVHLRRGQQRQLLASQDLVQSWLLHGVCRIPVQDPDAVVLEDEEEEDKVEYHGDVRLRQRPMMMFYIQLPYPG